MYDPKDKQNDDDGNTDNGDDGVGDNPLAEPSDHIDASEDSTDTECL